MTALRKAAQQALEALEELNGWQSLAPPAASSAAVQAAINLSAALAEPQEPVAVYQWRKQGCADWYDGHPDPTYGYGPYQTRTLYTAPPQRKPEPVALDWLHKWANQDDGEPETQWHEGYEAARRVVQIHLTTPPQRLPLTEEEIKRAAHKSYLMGEGIWNDDTSEDLIEFARAVERAHGIT